MPQRIPLYDAFPGLMDVLPRVELGVFPTPVRRLKKLGGDMKVGGLYVKCDDVTAPIYGGNKIRKLEFLFAEAKARGATEVMTFGFAGSNHALATAVSAKLLGMKCLSMLMSQENHPYVRENLLMGLAQGAEFHEYAGLNSMKMGSTFRAFLRRIIKGRAPYIIPPGGSSPLGGAGYVNAAYELKLQIESGLLPEPDRIYIPLGTSGSAMGLALGLRAAGLKCELRPVRIVPDVFMTPQKAAEHFIQINRCLHDADPLFPQFDFTAADANVELGFLGSGYAHFTKEGDEAVRLAEETEGIHLDGTYTGKTFAALMADAQAGRLEEKTVLFWNTKNSRDLTAATKDVDYRGLPKAFHKYWGRTVNSSI